MNKVILMGRLIRDPRINYSQGEHSMAIARFTLAVNRPMRKSDQQWEADFIQCVCFGKTAEVVEKYVFQGKKIVVVGRIQTGSYINRDGQRVYTTDVVAEEIEFAESKAASSGSNGSYQSSGGYQGGQQFAPAGGPAPETASIDGFMNIPDGVEDEGLPFN